MFVVTLPASARKNPAAFARQAKRAGADLLEIRGDLTPSLKPFTSALPILLSPRGHEIPDVRAAFIDLEMSEIRLASFKPAGTRLILSFHDHEKTPPLERLKAIVSRMRKEKPWAVKIATFVRTYDDLAILFALQDSLKRSGVRSVVLGMGEKAHLSRVTSPLRNLFTYATVDEAEASVPGQLPLSFYALTKGRKSPKLFGIIGGPQIVFSKSPLIHNALFQRHKIDALYSPFPSEHFAPSIRALSKVGVVGFSVTAPFKRDAFTLASEREATATKLGVINTLLRSGKGWSGCNTDWVGIAEGYPELRRARRIAILGAGGAVPSAILAVRSLNPKAEVTVYARDTAKAEKSLARLDVPVKYISDSRNASADVVLCAISEDRTLSFPSPASSSAVAIDLRYGRPTRFLVAAAKAGYRTRDGVPMLVHQALKQFTYFTGISPSPSDVAFLTRLLSSASHGQ